MTRNHSHRRCSSRLLGFRISFAKFVKSSILSAKRANQAYWILD